MALIKETRLNSRIIRRRKIILPRVCYKTDGAEHDFEIIAGTHGYNAIIEMIALQGLAGHKIAKDYNDVASILINGAEFVLPISIPFKNNSNTTIEPGQDNATARIRLAYGYDMSTHLVTQGGYDLTSLFHALQERPWGHAHLIDPLHAAAKKDRKLYRTVDDLSPDINKFKETVSLEKVLAYEKGRSYDFATAEQIER